MGFFDRLASLGNKAKETAKATYERAREFAGAGKLPRTTKPIEDYTPAQLARKVREAERAEREGREPSNARARGFHPSEVPKVVEPSKTWKNGTRAYDGVSLDKRGIGKIVDQTPEGGKVVINLKYKDGSRGYMGVKLSKEEARELLRNSRDRKAFLRAAIKKGKSPKRRLSEFDLEGEGELWTEV